MLYSLSFKPDILKATTLKKTSELLPDNFCLNFM